MDEKLLTKQGQKHQGKLGETIEVVEGRGRLSLRGGQERLSREPGPRKEVAPSSRATSGKLWVEGWGTRPY